MKSIIKPLWSYDVQKTEQWLTDQAKEGYHLKELHRSKRRFTFEKSQPKDVTYRIGYDKIKPATLSNTMRNDGWEKVTQSGKWYVIANERPEEEVTTSTSRDTIIKRNNFIFYGFMAILIYITFATLVNVALFTTAYIASDGIVEVEESPFWIITYIAGTLATAFYFFMIYSVWKIKRTNKALSQESQTTYKPKHTLEKKNLTKAEEKQLKRDGLIIKRRKLGWMYSPDKLEKWLEQQATEGNRLHRVNKLGTTFYFRKGEPQHIKYSADYQNLSNDSYFEIHRQAGWKDEFSSKGALQKWTIWSKEYEEGETAPALYSDKTHKLKQAKKVAFSYTMLFLPLVLMYIFIASMNLSYLLQQGETWTLMNTNTAMFFLLILVFGTFITKTWMYYFRLRRA
ncbi:DUF2812 domain-containing protein [Sutcliffiella horikoshii]|uniref:DUF2812 domain-containing protein n=1 Tax=Sutcliffiella horikoshii TaxID=79883 RepID=A0AA95B5Q7_9BACI|nr:DUF2812 domain-containing protein [Sutcliffiella horikoshii]TYS58510.1 DUF2812 domain-containing protein [Sutcliffiella horikoshii]